MPNDLVPALPPVGFVKRLTQAVSYGLTGGWFSPNLPQVPQHQETAGRRFDYLPGYNITPRPRRDSGIDFQTLRNFAKYYDVLRMLIERRKDQITTFGWSVSPTDEALKAVDPDGDEKKDMEERAQAATKFLKYPDGRLSWNTWLRSVLEDMLVLDAVAIWPVYEGKQLKRLERVDPATIKLVIDESGRTPEPPWPAYQQVLHGVPTADFRKDELLYFISNPSSDRIYGLGKVEQALVTIQIGLRREASQLQFFTDGNVPAALVGVPDTWPQQAITHFQSVFDSLLSGDTGGRRKLWFVPGEAAKNVFQFKSEEALLKTPFDEWIARLLCFCFGEDPTPFIAQVNRATAGKAKEKSRDEGMAPTLMFIKDCMDFIITSCMKMEGLEFKWDMEVENDPETQASIDDIALRNGSRSLDEVRQRDGLPTLGVEPMIYLPTGPVPVHMFADGTAPNLLPPAPPAPIVHQPPPAGGGGPAGSGNAKPGGSGAGGKPSGGQGGGAAKPAGKPTIIQPPAAPTKNPAAAARLPAKQKPSGNVGEAHAKPSAALSPPKNKGGKKHDHSEGGGLRKAGPFRFAKTRHYYTTTKGSRT